MRYSRQSILAEIGAAGQEKLASARVLCIGAGGLGCPALLYLAGAGIGRISVVDFDRVDISNLHRQILFTSGDEGKLKASAAAARLAALNPEIDIRPYDEELTGENALSLVSGHDIVIDGTDNFAAKFLINDVCVKLGKTLIYGAIQGFDGQVSVFNAPGTSGMAGPCYRCLHPQPPQSAIMNCAEAGVIGTLAGIVGSVQAMEAIKLILNHGDLRPLSGRLWLYDARSCESRTLALPKRADCPTCSKPPEEIVPQYSSPVCAAAMVAEISCGDLTPSDYDLIDVREREEWEAGHIEGARHLPLSALQRDPGLFAPAVGKQACLLYCQRGMRSRKAAEILLRAGHTGIHSLAGGYEAWCRLSSGRGL